MSKVVPWESIAKPSVDYNVRRIAGTSGIPLYWGRNANGQSLMLVELTGDHTAQFRKEATRVHGVGLDLRAGESFDQQRLVLTLARHTDQDLFLVLCETLVSTLSPITDPQGALTLTMIHLKRWKSFLSGRNARLLSEAEIRGLYAELHVLRALYHRTLPQQAAVAAWRGPDDAHQDFIFGETAIEVKSLSGHERSCVRISSEDQLEGLTDNIFLFTVRLSEMGDAENVYSLNELVQLIEYELNVAEAQEQFTDKLGACGYVPMPEYDEPRLLPGNRQAYRVGPAFPRLVRSQIAKGLARVSYDIELEAMAAFKCDEIEIFGGT
jgi:hypothetical protein